MKKSGKHANHPEAVDDFLAKLDHPFKVEVEAVREIIKSANPGITEQVKWNAPSFSYKEDYIATFNLRAMDHIHLIFHNPAIAEVKSGLLEGDYTDRRMAYFSDMNDVEAKKQALENAVGELVRLIERSR